MAADLTARIDALARRHRRRFLRDRDLPAAMAPHFLKRSFEWLKPALVVDVGANTGQYGQLLRTMVGYRGPILSFEPLPDARETLQRAAAADGAWTVMPCALGAEPARATFHVMAGREFSSLHLPAEGYEGRFHGQHRVERAIEVEVDTLDRTLPPGGPRRDRVLKLDTQGHDLQVLVGGARSLDHVALLQTELAVKPIYAGAPGLSESIDALGALGFELAALFPNNEGHFPRLIELDALFVHTSLLPALE